MMKLLSKILALCLVVAVAYIFYDNYRATKGRDGKGIGIEIHPDTGLFCNSQGIQVKGLKVNQTLDFPVLNASEIGSLKESLLPPGARLRAKVVAVQDSPTLGQRIVIFEFTHLLLGDKRFPFSGYIAPDSSRPGDTLRNDGKFLGSFAGMEGGPVGIIGGFVLGEKAISTLRRHTACPLSFIIAPGLASDTPIHVRAYKPVFLPLGVNLKTPAPRKSWAARVLDWFS